MNYDYTKITVLMMPIQINMWSF